MAKLLAVTYLEQYFREFHPELADHCDKLFMQARDREWEQLNGLLEWLKKSLDAGRFQEPIEIQDIVQAYINENFRQREWIKCPGITNPRINRKK
jgi:hypothetical protein